MKIRTLFLMATLGVLSILTGCGDTPSSMYTQAVRVQDEAADALIQIKDEESAKDIIKLRLEPLKHRWEYIDHQAKKLFKNDAKFKDKKEYIAGYIAILDESAEVSALIEKQKVRLNKLRREMYIQEKGGNPSETDLAVAYPKIGEAIKMAEAIKLADLWPDNPLTKKKSGGFGGGGFPGGGPGGAYPGYPGGPGGGGKGGGGPGGGGPGGGGMRPPGS